MSRLLLVLPVLALFLLPLGVGADPPAPAGAPAAAAPAPDLNMALPATFGPLDLVIYHNPGCHICQGIVKLRPDLLKLDPK